MQIYNYHSSTGTEYIQDLKTVISCGWSFKLGTHYINMWQWVKLTQTFLFGVRRISKPRESNIILFDERGVFSTNGKHKIMGRQRQNGLHLERKNQ